MAWISNSWRFSVAFFLSLLSFPLYLSFSLSLSHSSRKTLMWGSVNSKRHINGLDECFRLIFDAKIKGKDGMEKICDIYSFDRKTCLLLSDLKRLFAHFFTQYRETQRSLASVNLEIFVRSPFWNSARYSDVLRSHFFDV